jgi:digeranylgeranylglycerophospholipid reductase
MRHDVVVVGNGPTGCVAARSGCKDHDVAIIGGGQRRVQCAGLISKSGMELIGVKPGDFVKNTVRGARMYSPGGIEIEIDGGAPKAYAVDRLMFDKHLLEMASDRGATYVEDWVTSLTGGVNLRYGGRLEAERIILATGTDFALQKQIGFDYPKEFLIGGQYEMDVECDRDFVEMYFNVPNFFAWVIPLEGKARVGLCVKSNPRPYLDAFVKKLEKDGRIRSQRKLAETFGIIPVHNPRTRTQKGNMVAVGDAAGQVKASTGGGIIFGALAAEYACEPDYEKLWRSKIGFDLRLHLMIHRFLERLSDRGKDRLFRMVKDNHGALEKAGDMDYARKTVNSLITDPGFMAKSAVNLPWLLADVLF